jgi:DUF1009 family protein
VSGGDERPLGLIAGRGRLPGELARAARRRGRRVLAVAFEGETDPGLAADVDRLVRLHLGELGALLDVLREAGASEAVLAGKIAKTHMYGDLRALRADARALALLSRLGDRRDDAILGALADTLEAEGIRLLPQAELVPELLAPEGPLGRVLPGAEQRRDVAFGWQIAKAMGGLDIGQTVVVRDRAVLAVEAIEGTDAAIRRGGQLGRAGACVVKVAKPKQDPRFDLPAVGSDTLDALLEARATVLAVEAGATLVLDREALVARADAAGVALLGVSETSAMLEGGE